ncbi:MAG: hypothetical protein R3B96_04925 [Pirellulaceae bacterium]
MNQLIHRRVLRDTPRGISAMRASDEQDREFLSSTDRWFRPVQVRIGPDGGLWVVDMVRYVIEHPRWIPEATRAETNVFAGQGLGRLWRISGRTESHATPWPVDEQDDEGLLAAFTSRNGVLRDLAHQRIIWDEREDLASAIRQVARTTTGQRLEPRHGILARLNELTEADERAILAETDSDAVAVTLPLIQHWDAARLATLREQLGSTEAADTMPFELAARDARHTRSIPGSYVDRGGSCGSSPLTDPWDQYEVLRHVDRDAHRLALGSDPSRCIDQFSWTWELANALIERNLSPESWKQWLLEVDRPAIRSAISSRRLDALLFRLQSVRPAEATSEESFTGVAIGLARPAPNARIELETTDATTSSRLGCSNPLGSFRTSNPTCLSLLTRDEPARAQRAVVEAARGSGRSDPTTSLGCLAKWISQPAAVRR